MTAWTSKEIAALQPFIHRKTSGEELLAAVPGRPILSIRQALARQRKKAGARLVPKKGEGRVHRGPDHDGEYVAWKRRAAKGSEKLRLAIIAVYPEAGRLAA